MEAIDWSQRFSKKRLAGFAEWMKDVQRTLDFRVSARGWCYMMENEGLITKQHFDKANDLINRCRLRGLLPIDFVADDSARDFKGVEKKQDNTVAENIGIHLELALDGADYYDPDWWKYEDVYIQMVVEKIDLVGVFRPVCEEYHIPIANSKGWSPMLQRAKYARRFKEAEDRGMRCVLLYCGDHDPDGIRISDTLRKNLEDVQGITWKDGNRG